MRAPLRSSSIIASRFSPQSSCFTSSRSPLVIIMDRDRASHWAILMGSSSSSQSFSSVSEANSWSSSSDKTPTASEVELPEPGQKRAKGMRPMWRCDINWGGLEASRVLRYHTVDEMVKAIPRGWTKREESTRRRVVGCKVSKSGQLSFDTVPSDQVNQHGCYVSCLYWQDRQQYFITTRDIINITEWLLLEPWLSYSDDDLARIRSCLRTLGAKTCYASRDGEFYEWVFTLARPKATLRRPFSVLPWHSIGTVIPYTLEYILKAGTPFHAVLKDKKRGRSCPRIM